MKLRNKKSGEIVYATMMASYGGGELQIRYYPVNNAESTHFKEYRSISELNEEWEDYEESKEDALSVMILTLTNYIENEPTDCIDLDDCKEMLKKLKAWKRLKDLGFKCSYHSSGYHRGTFTTDFVFDEDKLPIMDTFVAKDLNLLFGGKE